LFFLIFGFGVIALAALFMRLFRLRKAFSTSLAVSKVRSEDCIPSLTNTEEKLQKRNGTKTYTRETNNNRS
jgi:hypothetical protein